MKALSWKPVLRGKVYCAPACGGGCTKAAYDQAVKESKDLARALNSKLGKGWETVVHENLGWHWNVVKGVLEVWKHSTRFTAMLNANPQFIAHSESAVEAIEAALEAFDNHILTLQAQRKQLR